MRILHVTDRRNGRGGAHRHLASVVRWQVEQGYDVHLAAGDEHGPGVTGTAAHLPGPALHLVAGLDARGPQSADLDRVWTRVRPDVVHLHTVVNPEVLEWGSARAAVLTVQDHRYFCPGRGKWTRSGAICRDAMTPEVCAACFDDRAYFAEVLGLTERRLRAVRGLRLVVLSDYMRRELTAVGAPASAIDVIAPFVDGLDLEARADGPPCILVVGRLTAHKGAREALEAWRRARLELPFVAAGTGPLRDELVEGGAQVLGWLDPHALSRAYRRARALLFAARWQEPFGITGLEALTMGVPVAAWNSGGVREWHGDEGLVAWGDIDGLADALRKAVRGPRPTPPSGFDREDAMRRLDAVYRERLG
jgi:glycosyltransferase involved in cell wall biosynthesis